MEIQSGNVMVSGDGSTKQFSFPHNCTTGVPVIAFSDGSQQTTGGLNPAFIDHWCNPADTTATDFTITYKTAPAATASFNLSFIAAVTP